MVHAGIARQVARYGAAGRRPPCVLLSGGETTVTVRGNGRGGRNAEFLLGARARARRRSRASALAGDTDGIDGSEDNAGAIVAPTRCARRAQPASTPKRASPTNDGYGFFAALGDLVVTGPTLHQRQRLPRDPRPARGPRGPSARRRCHEPPGRPKREYPSAQREGVVMTAPIQPSAQRIWDRCEALARLSELDGGLTRVYLSDEQRRANELVLGWMREAGMSARLDADRQLRRPLRRRAPRARRA